MTPALLLLGWFVLLARSSAEAVPSQPGLVQSLLIYCIDVEGGQATLFVGPNGTSLLVDTGWPGNDDRDAQRIQAATRDAGIARIDHLLVTHFQDDHVGGLAALASRVQVGEFIDHGPNREDSESARKNYDAYLSAIHGKLRYIVHPGDSIDMAGASILVVASDGETSSTVRGLKPAANPFCVPGAKMPADATENARSVGILVTFGKFRAVDLADLTKAKETELVCPNNPIGEVDLFLASNHGLNQSNAAALVDGLGPRVVIMNNGPHRGGSPEAWKILHEGPGLEDIWQLHTAEDTDAGHNTMADLIANPAGAGADGFYIKVIAKADGGFSVTNARTRQTTEYPQR